MAMLNTLRMFMVLPSNLVPETCYSDYGWLCLTVVFLSISGQLPLYYIIWGQNRLCSHSFQNVSIIRRYKIWRI